MILEVKWVSHRHHDRKTHLIPNIDSDRTACGYLIPKHADFEYWKPRAFNRPRDCRKCLLFLERGDLGSVVTI